MEQPSCVDVVVTPDGRLTHDQLGAHLIPTRADTVRLDLTHLTFIDPAGLVALASIAQKAAMTRRDVAFRAPADPSKANYLSRMDLGTVLGQLGIHHDLPPVRRHDTGSRLVELRRFDSRTGVDAVVDALVKNFVPAGPAVLQPLYTALSEMAANVSQHSGAQHGHIALQRFRGTGAVELGVGDGGIGLLASLARAMEVRDDRSAVVWAARRHESAQPAPGRGQGISRVIEAAGHNDGTVRLISGTASGLFARGSIDPQLSDLPTSLPGTVAHVRLSLKGAPS